jgi:hypothetical protein
LIALLVSTAHEPNRLDRVSHIDDFVSAGFKTLYDFYKFLPGEIVLFSACLTPTEYGPASISSTSKG